MHSCAKIMEACERTTTWLRISAGQWSLRSHLDLTSVQHRAAERFRIDFAAQAPGPPARAGWQRAAVMLALAGVIARAQPATANPAPLPLLTTAHMAHSMTAEEAARGYPVLLRAVATYYDPYIDPRHAALFVLDETGGIMVALPRLPVLPIHAGTLVEIRGVTGGGDFAPLVEHGQVRVIGESRLPREAPRASLGQLISGETDGQWVEVEGVVHSVRETAVERHLGSCPDRRCGERHDPEATGRGLRPLD